MSKVFSGQETSEIRVQISELCRASYGLSKKCLAAAAPEKCKDFPHKI